MDAPRTAGRAAQGTLKVRAILGLPELLTELGVDPSDMLGKVGLRADILDNPEESIGYPAVGRLLNACAEATGCEDFGLQLGMRQSAPGLGLLGYVAINAPTVRDALQTIVDCLKIDDTGGVVSLDVERGFALLRWSVVEPGVEAAEHINDAAIAVAVNIMRRICGADWRPAEALLTRRRPDNASRYLKFFDAPVQFETDTAAIAFDATLLDRPVEGRDAQLHGVLAPLLAQAVEATGGGFVDELHSLLRGQALSAPLSPERAAAALAISPRTLSRRLAEAGFSFSELAQSVRLEAAERLLRTDKSLAEIAVALGYSGPTAFIRAFKQGKGETPARWRRRLSS
jgi:AraC-like DNA-binding protein